ncbi:MAG: tetratricopeptide repeat protein [bacterium]|nr:tetratricopeptide repeat protein [bacterium]
MVSASRMAHRIGPLAILALAALVVCGAAAGQGKQQQKKQKQQQQKQQQEQQKKQKQQQIVQTLSKVDRKLLSYATADARNELKPVRSEADAGVLVALGRVLEQEKKLDEAAAKFREAAKTAPGDPAPWVYLGEAYRRQKREGDAKSAFKEAEKRAGAEVGGDAKNAMAHYYRGVAQQGLGQYGAAMASLGKARQLDPNNPLPVYQLGVTRALEQKNWQEAVDLLTEAIEMNPSIAYAYFYRGQAASKIKRNDLLIADLGRFIKLAPEAPEAAIAARIVASVRR